MDGIQEYLYRELYALFYRFCLAGTEAAKVDIMQKHDEIERSDDQILQSVYKIVLAVIEMKEGKAWQWWVDYKDRLGQKKEDFWYATAIHALIYEYIFPNEEKKKEFQQLHRRCEKEINEERTAAGETAISPLVYDSTDLIIDSHIKKQNVMKQEYENRIGHRNFRIEQRSYLMILKGFSSSTPFFYDALRERFHRNPIKGGGLFIKWRGNGIIIDPGINFVENMHLCDLNINDVQTVVITHDHIDHNGDLMVVDDLLEQMHRRVILYADKDTIADHGEKTLEKHFKIHIFGEEKNKQIYLTDDKSVTAEYFETEHIKDKEGRYVQGVSYGLKITCENDNDEKISIGITSDTKYMNKLPDILKDCRYIVANFSETSKEDYRLGEEKKTHLGYRGCLKLIKECNEKSTICEPIYIISEFWGGKGDVRREVVRKLRENSGYQKIIPGDIGMTFMLDNDTFLCDFCEKETMVEEIRVVRQKGDYSRVSLLCNECVLDSK